MPDPSAAHAVPFQTAILLAVMPPAEVKVPPTTKLPLANTANEATSLDTLVGAKADHVDPFQRATRTAAVPPAVVKRPPAIKSPLGITVKAVTVLFIPVPNANHAEPFQRATRLQAIKPAFQKLPPITRSPLGNTASDKTSWLTPLSNAVHAVPFQRAMRLTVTPPADIKVPPAIKSLFGMTTRALTWPLVPEPTGDHVFAWGFQTAMLLANTLPAMVNEPPTTREVGSGPSPSGSHTAIAFTVPSVPGEPIPGCQPVEHPCPRASGVGPNAMPSATAVTANIHTRSTHRMEARTTSSLPTFIVRSFVNRVLAGRTGPMQVSHDNPSHAITQAPLMSEHQINELRTMPQGYFR